MANCPFLSAGKIAHSGIDGDRIACMSTDCQLWSSVAEDCKLAAQDHVHQSHLHEKKHSCSSGYDVVCGKDTGVNDLAPTLILEFLNNNDVDGIAVIDLDGAKEAGSTTITSSIFGHNGGFMIKNDENCPPVLQQIYAQPNFPPQNSIGSITWANYVALV